MESKDIATKENKKENLYELEENYNLLINMTEEQKEKYLRLNRWSLTAMKLSVSDKNIIPLRGEIWTVELGENVGNEMNGLRPCIVYSMNDFNEKSDLISIIPITHGKYALYGTQFQIVPEILLSNNENIDGTAKAENHRSVSKKRFGKKIGELNNLGIYALNKAILTQSGQEELIKFIPVPLE